MSASPSHPVAVPVDVKAGVVSKVLSLAEAATLVRCSRAHLCNLIHNRVPGVPHLPSVRIGRRVLFRRESLERSKPACQREPRQGLLYDAGRHLATVCIRSSVCVPLRTLAAWLEQRTRPTNTESKADSKSRDTIPFPSDAARTVTPATTNAIGQVSKGRGAHLCSTTDS